MKILRLRALNINSLKGEIDIDFVEFLKGNALFAITGETGSGKTTLLDIISCALYGRTARLLNPRELMSRGTGEAMCEVEFEINKKIYRSSWSLRRARKGADGKFQSPKMELSIVDTGKVIVSGSKDVPKKVERITGLDFGRFTQSMMLAQGSFDAFLKAKEKDRSALLEKITGTKIYSEISKLTYSKYSQLKQDVEKEKSVLEGIDVLEPEVRKEREELLQKSQDEKVKIEKELMLIESALKWKRDLVKLAEEYEQNSKKFNEATLQKEQNREKFDRLKLALKALELDALYTKKIDTKESLLKREREIKELSEEIAGLLKRVDELERECKQAEDEYEKESQKHKIESQKVQKARGIKVEISSRVKEITALKDEIERKESIKQELEKELYEIKSEEKRFLEEIESCKSYLSEHALDENLGKSLSLIEQLLKRLQSSQEDLSNVLEQKKRCVEEIDEKDEKLKSLRLEIEPLEKSLSEVNERYKNIEDEVESLDRKEPELRDKKIEYLELKRYLSEYRGLRKLLKDEIVEKDSIKKKIASNKSLAEQMEQKITALKDHVATLKEKKEREILLKKYEEDRKRLVKGKPCFLCGATEHPYVEEYIKLSLDETEKELKEKEKSLQESEESLSKVTAEMATLKAQLENSLLEIEKIGSKVEEIEGYFKKESFSVNDESEKEIEEVLHSVEVELSIISSKRSEKRELLKRRDKLADDFQKKQNVLRDLEESYRASKNELEHLKQKESELHKDCKEIEAELSKEWESFGLTFDAKRADAEFKELTERGDRFEQIKSRLGKIEQAYQQQAIAKKEKETKIASLIQEIDGFKNRVLDLEKDVIALQEEQTLTLNVLDIDKYEEEIGRSLESKRSLMTNRREEFSTLTATLQEKQRSHKSMESEFKILEETLKSSEQTFEQKLKTKGFESEKAYREASLPADERMALEETCKKLEKNYNETKALVQDSKKRLEEHKEKAVTDKEIKELESGHQEIKESLEMVQREIGRIMQELKADEMSRLQLQKRLDRIEKLQKELDEWTKLNELIGSADGAKFSKFAQGITLDQLIYLANRHLKILTDRYYIIRRKEENHLLELDIVDKYQGDEIRPAETLSGGESFLVSLSLALGLSELASQRFSIDSLFLDEGFGTLDKNSLETALEALNLLESKEKMVGVISHIEALKEHIPLQIRVKKMGGGVSVVEIVGL